MPRHISITSGKRAKTENQHPKPPFPKAHQRREIELTLRMVSGLINPLFILDYFLAPFPDCSDRSVIDLFSFFPRNSSCSP